MNRLSYRLVFNRSLGALVAVAECTRGRGKSAARGARGATATASAALLGSVLMASHAWAETPIPGVDGRGNFATFGQAGTQLNGNQLLVNQVGGKSILNWQKFNLSAGAGVQFRQVNNLTDNQLVNGASFTSLNRIWDINPSVIAGSITQGAGQKANIILVNSNGIAFMGGSQVNLNSFTATTLNMADRYVTDRLLGDPTSPQFAGALDGTQARGFIKVFEGANITADSQGRVMLIAPTVINRGNISAPDGQVILAAGTKAYLRTDDTNNNLETRGLLIEVDSSSGLSDFVTPNTSVTDGELDGQTVSLREPAGDLLGHATNAGTLSAARGNVTMVGYAVNQNGIARATSSVVANGSVYLMAKDTYSYISKTPQSNRFGQVVMGEGSLTEVLPETQDTTTSVDGTTGSGQAAPSEVRAIGRQIHMANGSTIRVPSGEVSLTATATAVIPSLEGLVTISDKSDGKSNVHLASGSTIDVSGLVGVGVSAGRNTVQVELRGDELKDSPVNQTGPLRGKTAWVDVQQALENAEAGVDTLIAGDSLKAYGARLERTIAERSTAGGKVVIDSAGSVVVDNGATINLSGGSVDYQQATVKTTVLSSAGKLVDLADAVASTKYDGIASQYTIDYGRWNKTETIELPNAQRVVRGYTDGQDAGSLSVFAPGDVYLRPNVVGSTITGQRQVASGNLPRGAKVYLGGDASSQGSLGGNKLNTRVVIDRSAVSLPAGFAPGSELPESLRGTTTIDADLLAQGRVAELSVITNQAADVRAALRAPTGGKLSITATDIAVQSDIVAAGGTISLAAKGNPGSGRSVRVADGVTLSTAGTWVNRLTDPAGASIAPVLDGGDISITASSSVEAGNYLGEGEVTLGQGVRLDASGGALLNEKGKVKGGAGGHITVKGYEVSGLASASLSAYGLEEGGELTLTARNITIGGTSPANPATGDLHLDAGFFAQGGFADYTLQALENLTVADNTVVQPVVAHRDLNADFRLQASGADLADISTRVVRDPLRRESADISLTALEHATDTGALRIGEGARIEVDPGASITLTGRKRLSIEGSLVAHGGKVNATLVTLDTSKGLGSPIGPQGNLYVGDQAVIDVSGVARTERDARGLLQGEVLAGGSVNLLANTGALITRSGSSIDVSGAGPVTLGERNETGGLGRVVASDAGSLSLRGVSLYLDGAVKGQAGSAIQSGGSLLIGSSGGASAPDSSSLLSNAVLNLELNNQQAAQADGLTAQTDLSSVSHLSVATEPLEQAGFDRLRFTSSDGIVLADGLDLGRAELRELQLDAARITSLGDARLSADAVRLGNYFEGTRVGSAGDTANHGGVLTASGRLMELAGDLRLQGMDRADLTGSELVQLSGVTHQAIEWRGSTFQTTGDYRHSALIQSSGDLTLRGGVVAPGGFADVQIRAAGRDVRIESAGTTPIVPLSALGRLSIEAQNITQAGYLVAPFGQISLNATGDLTLEAGSVTSVAGTPGQVLPLGQLLNGIEWRVNLKPEQDRTGQTTLDDLPGKELRLSGGNITLAAASDGRSAATVNVSGGGDLQAYEFTAGPGGSRDILTDANTYAIIPGYQSGFAPDDAQESTGLAMGSAIYLRGVRGLADGKYVLLPAHYALLPGAMAVRLNGDAAPIAGQNHTRQDGIQVAAGYLTDSRSNATRSGDWVGVQVLTQEQVKARSEFTVARASSFFAGTGTAPQDAGLLSLSTQGELLLGASIRGAAASGGQGMAVDISAPNLLITSGNTAEAAPGTTALSVDQLTGLGARSLLLGATRKTTDGGTELTVAATTVTLDNDADHALAASEVMLAARDTVTLASGSLIDAQGAGGDAGAYTTEGNGAFVRAASTSATFTRSGAPDRSAGVVTGASDAVVQAARSIAVDATQANDFAGQTVFSANGQAVAGELAIGATRISFGRPTERPEGLTLDPDALAALQGVKALTLTSYSSFDLYDGAEVGGVDDKGVPLLGKLTLEGGGLTGLENEGMSASLRARELTLNNTAGVGASLPPTQQTLGSGTLDIVADKLTLGAGDKTIDGFSVVNIRAAEIVGADTGKTTVNAQTTVQTDRLGGAAGSSQTLDTGAQALGLSRLDSGKTLTDSTALGAGWTLTGASVALDTTVALRSGSLSVQATSGDLTLGTHADIDVSGREVSFFNVTKPTWGGDVRLTATTGSVVLATADAGEDQAQAQAAATGKARINVSGAAGADGGTLTASAVNGGVDLSGVTLVGQAAVGADGGQGTGARVRVDAQDVSDFSAFNTALNEGGFSGERTVRTRSANGLTVAQGDVVRADTVNLTADGGALVVEGRVSASGNEGGRVALNGQSVTLTGTARVEARANTEGGQGGQVEIGAATQVSEAAAGNIDLQEGSTIDVSGGDGGTLHLRAQRKGTGVAVTALDSRITGAREVNLEAVRVYNKTGNVALNVSTTDSATTLGLTKVNSDNTAYAGNHTAIKAALGQTGNNAFHILSGVEVRAGGNITLGADWNLVNSAAGGEAGVLTLRAGGNLAINNNLSDGFVNATAAYPSGSTPLQDSAVRGGRSWAYNLVAGADAASANVLATRTILEGEETGDITVAAGKLVRTGTGDIRMAAGRDITLASATSVVYTAGTASPALSGVTAPATAQRAYFTQGGGDVSLTAARDIVATVAPSQLWTDWLYRQGRLNAQGTAYEAASQGQLAWWVRFDRFAQGVGALGGGDVNIVAGHDVRNLSASAPTQGRMASVTPDANSLVRTGGGDVTVEAGNNIRSGQYFADNGDVKLVAGHAVTSGREVAEQPVYTMLALGDGSATVRATRDANIGAVVNPTLVVQDNGGSDGNNTGTTTTRKQRESLFSTYGEDSGVSLDSLLGDAVLHENLLAAASAYTVLGSSLYTANKDYDAPLSYLPPTLALTAFTGDVAVNGPTTLMPSNQGQLELLAQGSVDLKGQITLSDADPATVAGVTRPTNDPLLVLGPTHAATPVHAGDASTAKVYAVNDDVRWSGSAGSTAIDASKALEVRAGRDVADFSVTIQHANASDRSVVQAGRDVYFTAGINRSEDAGIRVGGLGTLEVTAGRDVNLGTSGGILSRGDLDNNNLPVGGASLQVMAGVGASGLDASAALQRLADRVSAGPVSDTDLWLVRWLAGNDGLSAAEAPAAVAAVQARDELTRSNEVRNMLFSALRETGRAANVADSGYAGSFDRGYAAMELVFPGISTQHANGKFTGYEGSINLFASRINTARGGDISFLVPGGGMVVGLANTPAVLTTLDNSSPGPLGVVASSTGSISGATRDDMLVNQSRILTVGGGDILLWSSEGDLDAGKGKKTATTVPPPVIRVDSSGKVTQELQGAASGSGIGALSTGGVTAGDVDLIAPKGTVNAGDAGIRAGNLNIAAQVVLGADNISVSGTSTGTPVADTSAVTAASSGATTGGDDTGSVVESLNQAAADSAKAAQELAESLRPYVVRVDVLGYGN